MNANVPKTVLVIDDAPDFLELTELILTQAGYRVVTAKDGREGLEKFGTGEKVAAVLTDASMPFNGCMLVAMIQGINPNVKVAFTTGLDKPLEGFSVTTLYKPFSSQDLLDLIHNLIGSP